MLRKSVGSEGSYPHIEALRATNSTAGNVELCKPFRIHISPQLAPGAWQGAIAFNVCLAEICCCFCPFCIFLCLPFVIGMFTRSHCIFTVVNIFSSGFKSKSLFESQRRFHIWTFDARTVKILLALGDRLNVFDFKK